MRLLLILLVVVALVWVWRSKRQAAPKSSPRPKAPPQPTPQDVVACAFCGVHLPASEALSGARGMYCCLNHQRQRES